MLNSICSNCTITFFKTNNTKNPRFLSIGPIPCRSQSHRLTSRGLSLCYLLVFICRCVSKESRLSFKWLRWSRFFGGHAAPSKHRALLKQTGEDRQARLMMGFIQLTYARTDTSIHRCTFTLTDSVEQRWEEFVPGRGVVKLDWWSGEQMKNDSTFSL